jgi:TM2 domain-containing membrane protein YozV
MLNLTDYPTLSPLELTPPETRRSPALAFTLSLLFPGVGHLYIGQQRNAAVIIVIETLALAAAWTSNGTLFYQAMLVLPSLYCFAVADAYFGAREWNAGATDRMTGNNPRIAAILNLPTKGFGYFYLGDRAKGITCFLIVSVLQAFLTAKSNMLLSVLSLTVQVAIAVDAYRVAGQRLHEINPELKGDAISRMNQGGLPPIAVTSSLFLFCLCIVLGYGGLFAVNGRLVTKGGKVELGSGGLNYSNTSEGISLTAPLGWDTRPSNRALLFAAGDGCSVLLLDQYSPAEISGFNRATLNEIQKQHPGGLVTYPQRLVNGRRTSAFAVEFDNKDGVHFTQTFLQFRRGLKIFSLVETSGAPACGPHFEAIEKSVRF